VQWENSKIQLIDIGLLDFCLVSPNETYATGLRPVLFCAATVSIFLQLKPAVHIFPPDHFLVFLYLGFPFPLRPCDVDRSWQFSHHFSSIFFSVVALARALGKYKFMAQCFAILSDHCTV